MQPLLFTVLQLQRDCSKAFFPHRIRTISESIDLEPLLVKTIFLSFFFFLLIFASGKFTNCNVILSHRLWSHKGYFAASSSQASPGVSILWRSFDAYICLIFIDRTKPLGKGIGGAGGYVCFDCFTFDLWQGGHYIFYWLVNAAQLAYTLTYNSHCTKQKEMFLSLKKDHPHSNINNMTGIWVTMCVEYPLIKYLLRLIFLGISSRSKIL